MSHNDSSRNSWSSLLSLILILFGSLVAGLGSAVIGLVVGASIGGNYAVDFEFAGNRGYEATGLLGAIIGFPVGVVVGLVLGVAVVRLSRRN
jgi:hypothetical protein